MDLDDIVKILVPKSTRKKLKKQIKKKSLGSMLKEVIKAIFAFFASRKKTLSAAPQATAPTRTPPDLTSANTLQPFAAELTQARSYLSKIESLAANAPADSIAQMRLSLLTDRVRGWVTTIEEIIKRTQTYHEDSLLAADRLQVPQAIRRLEKQLSQTSDPTLQQKLERTLENRRKQLTQLEQTANQQEIVALKVENTLAQLGLIYSQLHTSQFTAERGGYERLTAEIDEEVHTLEDYLATIQELQQLGSTWT